jgi:multicomponent Na+:H+ antiporter subunit F
MSFFTLAAYIAICIIGVSTALTLVRFIKGPSLPDRIISLDVFSANLLVILAIYSILSDEKAYLDIALILALVAFIGTMSFAYYLVQKSDDLNDDERSN